MTYPKMKRLFRGTWKGREGTSQEIAFDSNPTGRRVVIHTWTDTGEIEIRVIRGDFWRKGDGQLFAEELFTASNSPRSVVEYATQLGSQYFAAR